MRTARGPGICALCRFFTKPHPLGSWSAAALLFPYYRENKFLLILLFLCASVSYYKAMPVLSLPGGTVILYYLLLFPLQLRYAAVCWLLACTAAAVYGGVLCCRASRGGRRRLSSVSHAFNHVVIFTVAH